MKRYAFKMRILSEHAREYERRHDEIWPELIAAHEQAGICDYSIFYDEETGELFGFLKLKDHHQLDQMGELDIVKKWWAMNEDIQIYENGRPLMRPLREVFHMD